MCRYRRLAAGVQPARLADLSLAFRPSVALPPPLLCHSYVALAAVLLRASVGTGAGAAARIQPYFLGSSLGSPHA